jgi:hypothetical protein
MTAVTFTDDSLKKVEAVLKHQNIKVTKKQLKESQLPPNVLSYLSSIIEFSAPPSPKYCTLQRDAQTSRFYFSRQQDDQAEIEIHPFKETLTQTLSQPFQKPTEKTLNPVEFKNYGLFSSFAPNIDSTHSHLSAQDSSQAMKKVMVLYTTSDPLIQVSPKIFNGTEVLETVLELSLESKLDMEYQEKDKFVGEAGVFDYLCMENQFLIYKLDRMQHLRVVGSKLVTVQELAIGMRY